MFVHDMNQFVTVQLLEETLAVLSQGKLCIDPEYSNEWVSGQEPRLTKKKGRALSARQTISYLLSQGSVNSGGSSSSASLSQESLGTEADQASGNRAASSSSSGSVFERSDEQAPGDWGKVKTKKKKRMTGRFHS